MNDRIILISDFFIDDFVGGAALNDEEIYRLLSKRFDALKIKSRYLYEGFIMENFDSLFIISNFFGISPSVKDLIQKKCKYILYCHDYKFVKHTNPAVYPDFMVPPSELINVDFHKAAHKIICQTGFQKDIYDKNLNLPHKTVNFSGNLWSGDHLDLLNDLSRADKNGKCAIINSPYPQKGVKEAVKHCGQNRWNFDIIEDKDYEKFLRKLSQYSKLVFFPSTPETFSRIVIEAKMMGLEIVSNDLIGASHESWYSKEREELMNIMREKKKDLVNILTK